MSRLSDCVLQQTVPAGGLDDGGESLEERPAQMGRLSSPEVSDPPLVPLALSVVTNHVMEEITEKLKKIKEGRDTSTTVTQHLGLCLRTAARKARPEIFHQLLHMEGLDVNDVDVKGISAMMYACQSGCEEIVKVMLQNNMFDPSLKDNNGNGLLHYAIKNHHLHIVELLLADQRVAQVISGRNNSGISPLILACTDGFLEIAQKLLSFPSVEVNSADDNGDSPLLHAVNGGFDEVVAYLLDNPGIQVDQANDNGDTALMCAANKGSINIVKNLLKRKDIKVNSSNTDGYTSLVCAADKGFVNIVKLLLSHKDIDINFKDSGGDSALDWAVDKGSPAHLSSSSTTGVVHSLHYHHHYWPAASRNHRGQIPGKRVEGNGSSSEDFGSNPGGSENLPGETGEI